MKNPPVIDEDGTINWGGGQYAVLDQNGGEGLDARASKILKHRATGNTIDIDAEYNATDGVEPAEQPRRPRRAAVPDSCP